MLLRDLESLASILTPVILLINVYFMAQVKKEVSELTAKIYREFVTMDNFKFFLDLRKDRHDTGVDNGKS